jgi:hypothetical protein
VSYQLIRQLKAVREEYDTARAALAFTKRQWPVVHAEPELQGGTFRALERTVENLEATYIARLFAEFEAVLRRHYAHVRPGRRIPGSDGLINGLGAHYRIPAEQREQAHRVRRFRHSVAHADPGPDLVPFVDALSWLNQFLSFIPDQDVP